MSLLPFSAESGGLVSGDPAGFPILTDVFLEILSCHPTLSSYGTFPLSIHVWNILSPNPRLLRGHTGMCIDNTS